MKALKKYPFRSIIPIFAIAIFILLCPAIRAERDANLSATNLVIEQDGERLTLILEGPVEVTYGDDRISADSAVVYMGDDLSDLHAAIETVELTGSVQYEGSGGTSGSAGQATYYADDKRIVLTGTARLNRGTFAASAGTVDYRIESSLVTMTGSCRISQDAISATASHVNYNLGEKTGSLTGSVVVVIETGGILFGDEEISEVEISSEAIFLMGGEGIIRTPEGPEAARTSVVAGNFTLDADQIIFTGDPDSVNSVTAEGDVIIDGPDINIEADRISLSASDRILRVEGNVQFSIMGQDGSAEEVEVNFASGWSIRLVGASVGGTVETGILDSNSPEEEDGTSGGE